MASNLHNLHNSCDNLLVRAKVSLSRSRDRLNQHAERAGHVATNERGASMVEYGLLLTFGLLVAFIFMQMFGQQVVGLFEGVVTTYDNVQANPNGTPTN